MGIRWRKSISIGPLRINLSGAGIGTSLGAKGYRVTKTATGRTRRTVSVPGTGLSWVKEEKKEMTKPKKKSKLLPILCVVLAIGVIGSCAGGGKDKQDPTPTDPPAAAQTTAAAEAPTTAAPTETTAYQHTYILNTSTKKFHYESCGIGKDIAAENREDYTGDRADLIAQGYEPCGKCTP